MQRCDGNDKLTKKYSALYKITYLLLLILVLGLSLLNLFTHLGETPIYSWDEARHGISAYEMLKKNEWIVNTYGYKNDYWNLKPPMSFWSIMLGYTLAGCNALGLRLFSAVSAFLTILSVALFTRYRHGAAASLISALVLAVSPKYIVIHGARTGDADALYVLFFTWSMISLILSEKNVRWLYLCGLCFALAFLTKSWHALNILAIAALYLLLGGKLHHFRPKQLAFTALCAVVPILVWGISRYLKDGFQFIGTMIAYDLLKRSTVTLEGHTGTYLYYPKILWSYYYGWLTLLACSVIVVLLLYGLRPMDRSYILAMSLWILVPLLLYTKAETKIGWYILPLYPAFALATGALCGSLLEGGKRNIIIQAAVIIAVLKCVVLYEPVIWRHIHVFAQDQKRVTFPFFSVDKPLRGARAYIIYRPYTNVNSGPLSEMKDWMQSDLLSAELYWDLVPKDGGIKAFLKDNNPNAVLIIPNMDTLRSLADQYGLKIVGQCSSICILTKQPSSKSLAQ